MSDYVTSSFLKNPRMVKANMIQITFNTGSLDKRDFCWPQHAVCVCGDLLAAKSMKPLKETFRNQTLKQTSQNYHNTLINI